MIVKALPFFYSIVETCELTGVDPYDYRRDANPRGAQEPELSRASAVPFGSA